MPSRRPLDLLRRPLAAAACVVVALLPLQAAAAQSPRALASDDTVAMIAAAWEQTSAGHRGHRAALLRFPGLADTGRIVRLSPAVRAGLARRAIPVTERSVVGDDTVLFHVARFESDSAGATVEMRSGWTTVLGAGARRCRTGSGNVERVVIRRTPTGWGAGVRGPIIHGDRVCAPIPPS